MGVAGQVVKDVFGSAKGRLGIDDPVLLKERAQKGREGLFVVERKALAVERELVVAKSVSSAATNLPRKTRLRTWTGSKKVEREDIQCV